LKIIYQSLTCKLCGSENIIRYGNYRGIQRWWCKDCQHKFADNDALPDMRTPVNDVSAAILMYYEGRRLNDIPRLMYQHRSVHTTPASIYKWVTRFSRAAIDETNKTKVEVSDVWVATESAVKINGKSYWLRDIIDPQTRFLLATKLSKGRTAEDIVNLLKIARGRAGRDPATILNNSWKGYPTGLEQAFRANYRHIRILRLESHPVSAKFIEYWHNTLKDRAKVMLHLKKEEHAQLILDGWLVHYNYFRRQKTLLDRTPAELAKADFKFRKWPELVYHTVR
jgi:transposase-like protein